MSPLEAAFNLYINTPQDRIHTHQKMFLTREQGQRVGVIPPEMVADVKGMLDQGHSGRQIKISLKMGDRLFEKIHRRIQATMTVEERRSQIKQLSERNISSRRMVSITGLSRTTIQKYMRVIRAADDRYKDIPTL